MQEEWHHDKRKYTFILLACNLILLDLDIGNNDRPSVTIALPSRLLSLLCCCRAVDCRCPCAVYCRHCHHIAIVPSIGHHCRPVHRRCHRAGHQCRCRCVAGVPSIVIIAAVLPSRLPLLLLLCCLLPPPPPPPLRRPSLSMPLCCHCSIYCHCCYAVHRHRIAIASSLRRHRVAIASPSCCRCIAITLLSCLPLPPLPLRCHHTVHHSSSPLPLHCCCAVTLPSLPLPLLPILLPKTTTCTCFC